MAEQVRSLENLKIKEDLDDIAQLTDRPNEPDEYGGNALSSQALKARFDNIPKAVLKGLNDLIDYLRTKDYSKEIKFTDRAYTDLADLLDNFVDDAYKTKSLSKKILVYLNPNFDKIDGEKGLSEYDSISERFQQVVTRFAIVFADILKIKEETIPDAISEAVSDLKGDGLSDDYSTLAKIVAMVEDAINGLKGGASDDYDTLKKIEGKIVDLLEGKSLDNTFNTLKEIDEYIKEHGSDFEVVLKNISTLGVTVATLAANVNANKGRIDTVENTTIPNAIDDLKGGVLPEGYETLVEIATNVKNNYNSLGMAIDDAKASAKKYTDEQIAKVSGGDTTYVEDSAETHVKIIPSGAYPYAFVNKIGGKTEKVTEYGENIAELSAYDSSVTLSNGEFSLNIPSNQSSELFTGVGLSANLKPYIRYAINKRDTTMPAGCSVRFEYYLSGEDADGNRISSNIGSPNSVLPRELGFAKNVNLSIDLSYYKNTTSASKTVKFKLSVEPMFEHLISAPVKSVITQGRNLLDDEALFEFYGWSKTVDGYFKGASSKEYFYTNSNGFKNLTLSFTLRNVSSSAGTPFIINVYDSSGFKIGSFEEVSVQEAAERYTFTLPDKAYRIRFWYANSGAFEIKDMMLNLGTTALPYEPYAVNQRDIPQEITSKEAYGDGGNVVDFDELKYSRTRGRKVFTGADSEGWEYSGGNNDGYLFSVKISGITPQNCQITNFSQTVEEESYVGEFFLLGDTLYICSEAPSLEAWKEYLSALNALGAPLTVVYTLENPEEISISEASDINPITIASGNLVIFNNENNLDMPNTIEYVKRVKEADV